MYVEDIAAFMAQVHSDSGISEETLPQFQRWLHSLRSEADFLGFHRDSGHWSRLEAIVHGQGPWDLRKAMEDFTTEGPSDISHEPDDDSQSKLEPQKVSTVHHWGFDLECLFSWPEKLQVLWFAIDPIEPIPEVRFQAFKTRCETHLPLVHWPPEPTPGAWTFLLCQPVDFIEYQKVAMDGVLLGPVEQPGAKALLSRTANEALEAPLTQLAQGLERWAYKRGTPVEVSIHCGPLDKQVGPLGPFFRVLEHGLRNILDHRVADPQARKSAGKAEKALVAISLWEGQEGLLVNFWDDCGTEAPHWQRELQDPNSAFQLGVTSRGQGPGGVGLNVVWRYAVQLQWGAASFRTVLPHQRFLSLVLPRINRPLRCFPVQHSTGTYFVPESWPQIQVEATQIHVLSYRNQRFVRFEGRMFRLLGPELDEDMISEPVILSSNREFSLFAAWPSSAMGGVGEFWFDREGTCLGSLFADVSGSLLSF